MKKEDEFGDVRETAFCEEEEKVEEEKVEVEEVKEEDEDAWFGDRMGSDGLGDKMGKYKAGWLAELGDNIG